MKYSRMLSRSLSSVWAVLRCNKGCGKSARLANAFLIILLFSAILPTRPAFAQDTQPTYTFSECEQVEENLLLDELNRITRAVLEKEKSGLDIEKIVEDNWRDLNVDAAVNTAVDNAIKRVQKKEGYWSLLWSYWSAGKAEEIATRVSSDAFESKVFRDAVEKLSQKIVDDLAVEMQRMVDVSASAAVLCVEEFIGANFSKTMAIALEKEIGNWIIITKSESYKADLKNILTGRWRAPTGTAVILIGSQFTKFLAKRLAQGIVGKIVTRILGKAAGSLIPVAGWIIGGVLIIFDLWDAQKGSLPEIQTALKGEDIKEEIRKQITSAVDERLEDALPDLSQPVARGIFEQWKGFLQDFEHALRLAEKNARFRTIIDGATADQVEKLTELVAIGDEALGAEWLARIIDTGDFERILALPMASFEILREEADPGLVLEWAALAGEGIVRVVQTQLYRVATPSDFGEREILERVLALEDTTAIEELMRLGEAGRAALLRLPSAQTKWVLTELSAQEVDWLATYLTGLPTQAQGGLVAYVMRERGLIPKLQGSEELRAKFPRALTLAQTNPRFETILNNSTADKVEKLSELVAVADATMEPEQLADMIDTGQFERILALPQLAFEILRVDGDPELVINWADLAGEAITQVVETELYRVAWPGKFRGQEELERVVALQKLTAIQMLMQLNQGERDILLELPTESAQSALTGMSAEELSWLTAYLPEQPPNEKGLLVARLLREPVLMRRLRYENIHQALLESPNARESLDAVAEWAERRSPVEEVATDKEPAIEGDETWPRSWYKYATLFNLLYVLGGLIILYLLWWGIFRRRQLERNGSASGPTRDSGEDDSP